MHQRSLWTVLLAGVFAALLPTSPGVAQPVSVGFSAPDSTQPIDAYRLPDWNYAVWRLSLNGTGTVDRRDLDPLEATQYRTDTQSDVEFGPGYEAFWESERQTASLSVDTRVGRLSRSVSTEDESTFDGSFRDLTADLLLRGSVQQYLSDRTFALVSVDGDLRLSDERAENDDVNQPDIDRYDFDTSLRLRTGLGLGRVRDVTPVIRALRVRERLRALGSGASLSPSDVQAAARQLARRPGYGPVYDRPDKYFWRDFFNAAGTGEGALAPFDVFYVADVLQEPVGRRLEGAELRVGPAVNYQNNLFREDPDPGPLNRTRTITSTLGAFVNGRVYRNLSLRHQLGFVADAAYNYALQTETERDRRLELETRVQWLWVLADRFRLDTRAATDFAFADDSTIDDNAIKTQQSRYSLSTGLTVFIENRLSVTASGGVFYLDQRTDGFGDDASTDRLDASFSISVGYFLSRVIQ